MGKQASKKKSESFLDEFLQAQKDVVAEEGEILFTGKELFSLLEQVNEQLAYWIDGTKYDPRKGASIVEFYTAIEVLDACCL